MKNLIWENVAKNIIIVLFLILAYPEIKTFLLSSTIASDKAIIGNFLVAVSILAVTACFMAFSITYEKIAPDSLSSRLLAHFATGLPILLIGLSLEMTSVLAKLLVGDFYVFNISLLILYLSTVLYDFWDLKRSER
ncbi:hypothetical protein HYS93_00045 [Candidatus Daviesbacteria bacterium]|nr:hypothetical protein [Candidatus Daviesbacteria bacterium]